MPAICGNISVVPSFATVGVSATSSYTITFGVTPPKGALLVAGFVHNGYNSGANAMGTPSGWTLVNMTGFTAGARAVYMFAKFSDGTETSVSSGTVSTATAFGGYAEAFDGVKSASGGIASLVAENDGNSNNAAISNMNVAGTGVGSVPFSSMNTELPALCVGVLGANATLSTISLNMAKSFSLNSGATQASGVANSTAIAGDWVAWVSAGTSDTPYWTMTTSRSLGSVGLVLRPNNGPLSMVGMGA